MNSNKLRHILSRTTDQAAALVARFERRWNCSYYVWLNARWSNLGLDLDPTGETAAREESEYVHAESEYIWSDR